jgi:DNA end-binding protein Ku
MDFVELAEVDPMYFQKPYHLGPGKGGGPAYSLLRDVLQATGKAGIAKVVIRARQHLAAVKAQKGRLILELMHFQDELVNVEDLELPAAPKAPGKREVEMARTLVQHMTRKWDPARYTDDYASALMGLIQDKIAHGGRVTTAAPKAPRGGKIIDLAAMLQESLRQTGAKAGAVAKPARRAKQRRAA